MGYSNRWRSKSKFSCNNHRNGVALAVGLLMVVSVTTTGCFNSSFKSMFKNDEVASKSPPASEPISITIWHESFEAALEESKSSGKPILADFTGSDWCHWCVKLKEDVFETDTFKTWARDNVVLLELDYPKRNSQPREIEAQNAELAKRYDIQGYPTVLFIDENEEVLGKMGYMANPNDWITMAKSQMKPRGGEFTE